MAAEATGPENGPDTGAGKALVSPHDTPLGATTRFLMELASWILGPWAAVRGGLPWWGGVFVAMALVALPATFNAPGDKAKDGVLVPGVVRLGIEVFLGMVVLASSTVLRGWAGAATALLFLAFAGFTGRRRARWLHAGAGTAQT